jgi:hypothetical protein
MSNPDRDERKLVSRVVRQMEIVAVANGSEPLGALRFPEVV